MVEDDLRKVVNCLGQVGSSNFLLVTDSTEIYLLQILPPAAQLGEMRQPDRCILSEYNIFDI